jgi:hypothetical protein
MSIWRRRHADTGTCKPRRAFKENECKWPMRRACRRARLRKITWHVLRHTFASHLVMSGVPLKAVQELMGHATNRDDVALLASEHRGRAQRGAVARSAWQFHGNGNHPVGQRTKRREREWGRRESNPANSTIWALYHCGISHKSAIRRGRWVARVPYLAWRTAIRRVAWTNGTMAVPRREKQQMGI